MLKVRGKAVSTNDCLRFNQTVARALVVNNGTLLSETKAKRILSTVLPKYDNFVERTFSGIYFTDTENVWLDRAIQNIGSITNRAERDLALFALYQACIAKRPYNLFHRANLYMRTADVVRSFGNKATWEKSFEEHFLAALREANGAVFNSGNAHEAHAEDFLSVPGSYDLVYMDPPYLNAAGTGVDYLDFYHFLEGITEYRQWPDRITEKYKHKPYRRQPNPWTRKETILGAFSDALERYAMSIVVVSYRSNGIPSVDEILAEMRRHGRPHARVETLDYKYVLSPTQGKEVLIVSEP
jgi:adenine-specific DNA methylase